VWIILQELFCRLLDCDGVIRAVEDLESEIGFLDAEVADLAEVARIDVGPGVALTACRVVDVGREIALIWEM
jgi:hypothetical protein